MQPGQQRKRRTGWFARPRLAAWSAALFLALVACATTADCEGPRRTRSRSVDASGASRSQPRLATDSETYELVAVLDGQRLDHLSRPVRGQCAGDRCPDHREHQRRDGGGGKRRGRHLYGRLEVVRARRPLRARVRHQGERRRRSPDRKALAAGRGRGGRDGRSDVLGCADRLRHPARRARPFHADDADAARGPGAGHRPAAAPPCAGGSDIRAGAAGARSRGDGPSGSRPRRASRGECETGDGDRPTRRIACRTAGSSFRRRRSASSMCAPRS